MGNKILKYSIISIPFLFLIAALWLSAPLEKEENAGADINKIEEVKESKEIKDITEKGGDIKPLVADIDWSKQDIDYCSILLLQDEANISINDFYDCLDVIQEELKDYKMIKNSAGILTKEDVALYHAQFKNNLEIDKVKKEIKEVGEKNFKEFKKLK